MDVYLLCIVFFSKTWPIISSAYTSILSLFLSQVFPKILCVVVCVLRILSVFNVVITLVLYVPRHKCMGQMVKHVRTRFQLAAFTHKALKYTWPNSHTVKI